MVKRRTIAIGIFFVALLVLAVLLANEQFSIISQSEVRVGEDGEPVWVINIAPTGPDEQILFVRSDSVDSYEEDGALYVPQADFSIAFTPTENYCEYSLTRDTTTTDAVRSFFSGFFGENYDVYRLGVSAERNVNVLVSPSKGDEKVINLAEPNQIFTFNDESDGQGTVRMQTLGTFQGLTECPDGGDIAVRYFDDGSYEFVGLEQEGPGSLRVRDERSDFPQAFQDVELDVSGRTLRGHKSQDFAIGSVLLTVDAEYFDVRYIPPSRGRPEIVDVRGPEVVEEGRSTGTSVLVKNVGNDDGRFKITPSVDNGYISPSSQSVDIEQGQTEQVSFILVAGEVDQNEESVIRYQVCSVNLFSDNYCEEEGLVYEIARQERILPEPDTCGDGQCVASDGENAITCPVDCELELECDLEHESLYQGSCECDPGYEYAEDSTGREYCAPIDTTPDWVIYVVIVLVFLTINAVILFSPKRR